MAHNTSSFTCKNEILYVSDLLGDIDTNKERQKQVRDRETKDSCIEAGHFTQPRASRADPKDAEGQGQEEQKLLQWTVRGKAALKSQLFVTPFLRPLRLQVLGR